MRATAEQLAWRAQLHARAIAKMRECRLRESAGPQLAVDNATPAQPEVAEPAWREREHPGLIVAESVWMP